MSRPAELTPVGRRADDALLEARGYRRCEHCGKLLPLHVSRCRRRKCPSYGETWARDTMRKIRENLRAYGGLAAMCTLTAPGVDAGLVWDRENCSHDASERCGKEYGCKVLPAVAKVWNDASRGWWRELNRLCKQRADRALRRLGLDRRGGLLLYEWELQGRGVWHLHFVVGMETPWKQLWAWEYTKSLRELAPRYGFGFPDTKPMQSPQPAEQVAGYLSKYLAKWNEDGSLEITETVRSAGRTLLNYVSRNLTAKSGITMRTLRLIRIAWAWREGHLKTEWLQPFDLLLGLVLLEQLQTSPRAP